VKSDKAAEVRRMKCGGGEVLGNEDDVRATMWKKPEGEEDVVGTRGGSQ